MKNPSPTCVVRALLSALLLVWLPVVAQEAVQNAPEAAQSAADNSESIDKLWQQITAESEAIKAIRQQMDSLSNVERSALTERLDEYYHSVYSKADKLIELVVEQDSDDADIADWKAKIIPPFDGIGPLMRSRAIDLRRQLNEEYQALPGLTGEDRFVATARAANLADRLDGSYQLLLNHIQSRAALEIDDDKLTQFLQQRLRLEAETLAGLLSMSRKDIDSLKSTLEIEPDNADLKKVIARRESEHSASVERLQDIAGMMESMQMEVGLFHALLLSHTGELTAEIVKGGGLPALIDDWLSSISDWVKQSASVWLFDLVFFLLILLLFQQISKLVAKLLRSSLERPSLNISVLVKNMLVSMAAGGIILVGLLIALSQIGISLGPMLAGLGLAGFAIGFALQDTLGNFASGFMILLYRPYDVGDLIEVAGGMGTVRKMNVVSTTITTIDNQTLVIPNSKIWGDVIKNVTAQRVRRVDLVFSIGYSDDIELAERVLEDIISSHDKVLKSPEYMVKLHKLNDSSVDFVVRPWTRTEDYWDVYWDVTRAVKMRFDAENISIPFPQRDVHVYTETPAHKPDENT
ncbi:MAG: mechanosensitive ion channel [Pseudomonadales bacterium]|nr:mechanosensitive ion channel [Pseudomonadales bacterium]